MNDKPQRRVVQISGSAFGVVPNAGALLFALCDDGSIWQMQPITGGFWQRVPNVPQEDDDV